MPLDRLHMNTLEITHSLTEPEITELVDKLSPRREQITDYTFAHRTRLIKPMVSYDDSAMALSWVPAAGEGRTHAEDSYTYHHLRRDLYDVCESAVAVRSRYVTPSSHLTIARFVTEKDFVKGVDGSRFDTAKLAAWIGLIEDVNTWLRESYWPTEHAGVPAGGEWLVGQEKGLDNRRGTLWYGGGDSVRVGRGF
jgi:vesicle-fusing ATPase